MNIKEILKNPIEKSSRGKLNLNKWRVTRSNDIGTNEGNTNPSYFAWFYTIYKYELLLWKGINCGHNLKQTKEYGQMSLLLRMGYMPNESFIKAERVDPKKSFRVKL